MTIPQSGTQFQAADGSSLGIVARNSSTASGRGISWSSSAARRFFLQSAAREILPRERVSTCLRRLIPVGAAGAGVDVMYSPVGRVGHYSGLQVCGSVWHCPVCASKISERRRLDLADGLDRWRSQFPDGRVLLVTFTLSHKSIDNLVSTLKTLKKARSMLVSGRDAVAFSSRYNVVSMVRSLELTYGSNGWHPHLHVLYFLSSDIDVLSFENDIKSRWSACVASAGGFASYDYGCDVRATFGDVSDYVSKFGREPAFKWTIEHEITKGVSKFGRFNGVTPMQLLYDAAMGDKDAKMLWLQYAVVLKGERQMFWSPRFRKLLGMASAASDEALAEAPADEVAILLARLNSVQWRRVLALDARGDLLEVAATGSDVLVADFLDSIGVTVDPFITARPDVYSGDVPPGY